MAVGTQDAGSQGALVAREKAKLRKVLRRSDLILFTACAIVGLESVAFAAQAITWLLVSLALVFIPYGMLVAELGSAFPVEGGPYEWVKMSFGRLAGSIVAVLYSRVSYESVTLVVFGVMVLLGVVFRAVGNVNRQRGLAGEAEFNAEGATSAGQPPG